MIKQSPKDISDRFTKHIQAFPRERFYFLFLRQNYQRQAHNNIRLNQRNVMPGTHWFMCAVRRENFFTLFRKSILREIREISRLFSSKQQKEGGEDMGEMSTDTYE